ncbi:MAG: hypothetical protein MZV49_22815 [Rhodopseudomonas palustris]|nr:hypothetical protein [Rhodopseudomonas palustris]
MTNGQNADLIVRRLHAPATPAAKGMSLLVRRDRGHCPGFRRGRKLDKIGHERRRTRPSCSSTTCACRPTTCSAARKARASSS